jgi:TP901 family phage tail tape measure protein
MAGSLGTIGGQVKIDVAAALASYAALRVANETTKASLSSISGTLLKVGGGFVAAGAGIAALFGVAVNAAANFEKKIDYFGAITNATKADMDAVAQKAIDMSKTTIYSADQMADAFVEFGKAGIATKDILGGVADATAQLAQAADISVAEASNTIVSIMSTFHVAAGDTMGIADKLAGAANASIVDVSDLATSLKYVGGIAEATGISFSSTLDALALLGNAGIKGSTAGTSLRQVMVSLTGPTSAATKELKALGIITADGNNQFIDAQGHLKDLGSIFQILQDHTKGLTDAQTLAATKTIFNSRALAAANILMHDGAAGFAEMNKQIGDTTAADVAHKRLDNLSGDITHLKNSVQTMLIQIGGPLQNVLRPLIQGLTSLVQWFGNLSPQIQTVVLWVMAGVAAFLLISGTLMVFIGVGIKLYQLFQDLKMAFMFIKTAITAVKDGMMALNVVMAANPVILIVLAVIALAAAFYLAYTHSATFRKIVQGVLAWLVGAAIDVKNFVIAAFNDIWAFLKKWGPLILAVFMPFIGIPLLIYTQWGNIVNFFKNLWNDITSAVMTGVNATINFFKKLFLDVVNGFIQWNKDIIKALIWITLLPKMIYDWVVSQGGLSEIGMKILVALVNGMKAGWETLLGWVKTWGAAIKNAVVDAGTWLVQTGTDMLNGFVNAMVTAAEAVWNWFLALPGVIWGLTVTAKDWLVATGQMLLNGFVTGIVTAAVAVWNWFASLPGIILGYVRGAIGWLQTTGHDIVWGIINGIFGAAQSLWQWFLGIPGMIAGFLSSAGTWLYDIGRQVIQGMINGIKSMAKTVADAAKSVAGGAINGVKSFLGIGSPSKKFKDEVGHWIPAGIAQGIMANQSTAIVAASRMAAAVTDAASMSNGSAGQLNMMAQQLAAQQLASLNLASMGSSTSSVTNNQGINVENLNVNNPKQEEASTSLPRAIRSLNYLSAGPRGN